MSGLSDKVKWESGPSGVPRASLSKEDADAAMAAAPLQFEVNARWGKYARASTLTLPHGTVHPPVFMPVGTQGTIKGLTPSQVEETGAGLILGNTYHLGLRPGPDVLRTGGGLHKFMGWKHNLLTDSGGFQMVSLVDLAEFSEDGVHFTSPHDGLTPMLLTPEKSMELQNAIGADIMMMLDDVVSAQVRGPRVNQAMHRTLRWLDRCIASHARPTEQALFAIIQGGVDVELRAKCLKAMMERNMPGYAIGGLSGGESKHEFWRVVLQCTKELPENKPRYVMGVGYAVDLVVCVALGADMADCVYPTRAARFGTALVFSEGGRMDLTRQSFGEDMGVIDPECDCAICKRGEGMSRSYLSSVAGREPIGAILLTQHNIRYQFRLMGALRQGIVDGTFPSVVKGLLAGWYGDEGAPPWVVDALSEAGIDDIPRSPHDREAR